MRIQSIAAIFILTIVSFSCATVRVVKSQPSKGGILAVHEGLFGEPASEKAARYMASNCPSGYKITEEGEEVVGQTSRSTAKTETKGNQITSNASSSATSGETETENKTEWRVKYKCKKT